MPQAQDFLTSLLNSSLELDPNTTTGASSLQDRSVATDAILHSINTGQEPTMVRSPSYGPIGDILQKLNIRKAFQPVSGRLRDQMGVAKKEYAGDQQSDREQTLKTIQNQGTQFGTESARAAATTLGEPELGAAFPKDVKGKGELVQSAQDIQIQKLVNSQDENERKMGLQQLMYETRLAASEGNRERAEQLMQIGQGKLDVSKAAQDLKEAQYADAPTMKVSEMLFQSLGAQEMEVQKQYDSYLNGGVGEAGDAQSLRYEQRLADIQDKKIKLLSGFGTAKSPSDVGTSVYGQSTPIKVPSKTGSKVKAAPAGLSD